MAALSITGSTGRLGGRIARMLAAVDAQQRLACRTPAGAPVLPGSDVVAAPYEEHDPWVSTYTALADGELEEVTDDVRLLTGRAPMSLADLPGGAG